jgi:hypothetical protein
VSAVQGNYPTVNIIGHLLVDGRSLAIGQICQHSVVLLESFRCPPTDAKLIVIVSGVQKVYDIVLPHGIDGDEVTFF